MVMVLPSLALLIDALGVISLCSYLWSRISPGQIRWSKDISLSSALKLQTHALVTLSLRAAHLLGQWNLFGEVLQYQPDRLLLGLVTQMKPDKTR
jgi:hypothetical protein